MRHLAESELIASRLVVNINDSQEKIIFQAEYEYTMIENQMN